MAGEKLAEASLMAPSKYSDDSGRSSGQADDPTDEEDLVVYHDDLTKRRHRRQSSSARFARFRKAVSPTRFNARRAVWLAIAAVLLIIVACLFAVSVMRTKKPPPVVVEEEVESKPTYCTTWTEDESRWPHMHSSPPVINSTAHVTGLPEGTKVVGIVFFGRSQYVDVLDCYLRRNLKVNGGVVDEFVFMNHTSNADDLAYVHTLLQSEPNYRLINPPELCEGSDYGCIWSATADPDTLYIKIDDDITYIHDDAIPQLIKSRIENPEPFAISANLINSPLTGWVHYHLGAIHAYLPETPDVDDPALEALPHRALSRPTWKPSDLPTYVGQLDPEINATAMEPPFMGHRWLPVKERGAVDVLSTPFGFVDSPGTLEFGDLWREWSVAAQQHYSLFQNLEEDAMHRYWLGSAGGFWNTQFSRYNLNFLAVWGRDVAAHLPIYKDDEHAFTVQLPMDTSRPLLIDSKAIVSHFHFYPQNEKMQMTDVLDRYRAYANENVCAADNKKRPLPTASRCPTFTT